MFRATKIQGYLKAMRAQGIGARQLLAGTDIDVKQVSHPDYLISLSQYEAVVANMMKLSGNPGIAFSLGDVLLDVGGLGILGYAMLSASTLRQALGVWIEYSNSFAGTPTKVASYRDISPGYELVLSSPLKYGALHRFEMEELLVQGMKRVWSLTGVEPVIGKVSFSYPEPQHRALYEDFFKCPVEFGAPKTRVRVLQPDLDAPIQTGNEELFQICAQHCQQVMRSIPDAGPLRNRIRSLFLTTPGDLPDLKAASVALGMSMTTLRRHLDNTGLSYQAIKDEFRFDLAREYLRSGHMAPKQVAYLLGFKTPSAFSRAFKVWSGQSPGSFLATEAD